MRMTPEEYRQRFPDRAEPVPAEYLGQWVAWDENRTKIIAHGETLKQVASLARRVGCKNPIMQKIPNGTFVGGA